MNDIHRLSGAYAVDALDPAECDRFETHLTECADCRAEVQELREAAVLLAATTETAPPAHLRERVLTAIAHVRPLPPETVPESEPAVSSLDAARGRHQARRQTRWLPLMVAAAVVAMLGLGAAVVPLVTGGDTSQGQLTATEQVLQAPDAEEVSVDLGEAGRATVVRSVSQHGAVIVTDDMAPPPADKVYQLWFKKDGEMVPAGLMPDEPSTRMLLEGDAAEASAVGITVEPAGGSQTPTLPAVAVLEFSGAESA